MSDSDIIEIGADGTFEIPKSVINNQRFDDSFLDKVHHTDSSSAEKKSSVFDTIVQGEYKVFRNQSKGIMNVIICLQDNEQIKAVLVSQNEILIDLEGGKELRIPLPYPVEEKTATSKTFQKYLCIQVNC
jgi:hypothetical protein|mmetsp:Transcript_21695/g.20998  ORF Transcript_21695/g.20998 Transcript_21695/m.20998 type:complete len:130 (+) Transcript_21695:87-476(+)